MEPTKLTRAYGKNRIDALSFFTPEEQAIIERYKAKSTELVLMKMNSKGRNEAYERGQQRHKQLRENFNIARKEGLFEAAGISLQPGSFKSWYDKVKMGDQLLTEYRKSHPLICSQTELLSPSPPSILDDPALGEPICT